MSDSLTSAVPAPPVIRPVPWRQLVRFIRSDIFVLAMFLSLLLIGGDKVALQAGGMTLRLVFPLLMTALGFLYLQRAGAITFPTRLGILFFLLAIAGAISTMKSLTAVKSLGYMAWVFFDFFIIIMLCYNLARLYSPEKILSLWFLVFRVHVFLLPVQIALNLAHGTLARPTLWFYETSYLAIFLTAYFGSALYMFLREGRAYALDFFLSAAALLVTASATAIFGMVFGVLLNFMVARQRLKLLLWFGMTGVVFVGLLYIFLRDSPYFNFVGGFLLQGGPAFDLVLSRGGNRVIRFLVGWDAFIRNPWTGIGIGGDTAYMDATALPDSTQRYLRPWMDTTGQPFCNIFIEVLGTMGILGFIPFCAILIYAIWQAIRLRLEAHPLAPIATAFLIGFFCGMLVMQLEGTMLRYYLWTPLGLACGAIAYLRAHPAPGKHAPADKTFA